MIAMPSKPEYSATELLELEYQALGMYISGHPIDEFIPYAKAAGFAELFDISEIGSSGDESRDGELVSAIGIVTNRRSLKTKKGDRMAFVTIEDKKAGCELIFFPEAFGRYEALTSLGEMVAVWGKLNVRSDEGAKIIVDRCETAENFVKSLTGVKVYIRVKSTAQETIQSIRSAAAEYCNSNAKNPLVIFFEDLRKMTGIKNAPVIELTSDALSKLIDIAGEGNVLFEKKKGNK